MNYKLLLQQVLHDYNTENRFVEFKSNYQEINELLWNKLPEILNDKQKKDKITNLLAFLRRSQRIKLAAQKQWVLV